MSRRSMSATFWGGSLACAVLLLASGAWAFGPPDGVAGLLGPWDGFFLEAGEGGTLGRVSIDVTWQRNRSIMGSGELLGLDSLDRLEAFDFQATVAADGVITGTGPTTSGRVVLKGDLTTFAGVTGDAAVWNPDLLFVPTPGGAGRAGATLLHPFPDANAPNIAGKSSGRFLPLSATAPGFTGRGVMTLMPRNRGSFPGRFDFIPTSDQQSGFSWPVRVTTSGDNQFIMIGQGKTGRMSYIGSVITSQGGAPSEIWGIARISLESGQILYNTYNAFFTPLNR